MSNVAGNNKSSVLGSSNRVNSTVNGDSRKIIRKEKIKFPVDDPRLSRSAGNCYVEKEDILEDMLDDDALEKTRAIRACQISNRPCSNLNDHSLGSSSHRSRKGRDDHDAHQLSASMMKCNQKQSQRVQQKKDAVYSSLVLDISESMNLLDSIDQNLCLIEETKRNKTRRQFEEWNSQVHGSIQMDISKQVNLIDSKRLNKKNNEDYSKFLEISNRKTAIFRDIIIESEYDPLEPNRRAIKTKTMRLTDPTKLDSQKAEEEGSILNGTKSFQKLGKDTLNVELWATGKIESTPYGVSMQMMGSTAAPCPLKSKTMQSNVKFDHFDYPKGNDAARSEMPRGKRIQLLGSTSDTSGRLFGQAPHVLKLSDSALKT